MNVDSALLFLGVALLPIYVSASGGIQPTHAVFAIFAVSMIAKHGVPISFWSLCLLGLTVHSYFVEIFYAISNGEAQHIINSVFILFNFVVVVSIFSFVRSAGLTPVVPGVLVAASIASATLVINGVDLRTMGESGRSTGSFNNPNQLGFFSVCLLSLTYILYLSGKLGYWLSCSLFAISMFMSISSLSKAAMISNLLVIIFVLRPKSRKRRIIWLGVTVLGTIVFLNMLYSGSFDGYLFMDRLSGISQEDDSSLASRGYFALSEANGLQLIFGLGAENINRIVGHEVHSTFGSIANNYGFIGLLLILGAIGSWVISIKSKFGFLSAVCVVAPALLYGITHNGIRFTSFWVLFASSIALVDTRDTIVKKQV